MTTISDIATYAALNKPSKSKVAAWKALQSVIVLAGDGPLEPLATLYLYFQPKATPAQLAENDFAWCASAAQDTNGRPQMANAYCDGQGRLIGLSGMSIHMGSFDGEAGYHDAQGELIRNATDKWQFPKWRELIPAETYRLTWYTIMSPVLTIMVDRAGPREAYQLEDGTFVYRDLWNAAVAGRDTALYCAPAPDTDASGGDIRKVLLPDLGGGRSALVVGIDPAKVQVV